MVQGKAEASLPPSRQAQSEKLACRNAKRRASELSNYYTEYAPLFAVSEQREWAQLYLREQLSDLERKSIEPTVLGERGKDINALRAVQQLIGEGNWDDDRILEQHQRLLADDPSEVDATAILDGSSFQKKGERPVGVQRLYCGASGKIANCQQGVFLAYVSSRGYTFWDRRLYMP